MCVSVCVCVCARARAYVARSSVRVYVKRGIWHNRLSRLKISKNLKKISYEIRRNFLLSQIVKNLLRKWSRFCKVSCSLRAYGHERLWRGARETDTCA
jgi:hypothetical protein